MKFMITTERDTKNKCWLLTIRQPSFISESGQKLSDPPAFYLTEKFNTEKEAQDYAERILNRKGVKKEDIVFERGFYTAEELAESLAAGLGRSKK